MVRATVPASSPDRCAQLADAHNLTAREQEILAYLAEGHSGAYISLFERVTTELLIPFNRLSFKTGI